MSNQFNIMNEIVAIEKALAHYQKLRQEFDTHALEHFRKTLIYKINKYIFFNIIEKVDYLEHDFYAFKFRYNDLSLFNIEDAIDELTIYKIAIERNNTFVITEYEYKKFLKYVDRSEGV